MKIYITLLIMTLTSLAFGEDGKSKCLGEVIYEIQTGDKAKNITCAEPDGKNILKGFSDGSVVDLDFLKKMYYKNPSLFESSKMQAVIKELLIINADKSLKVLGDTPLIVPMCTNNPNISFDMNIESLNDRKGFLADIGYKCQKDKNCSNKYRYSIEFCELIIDYYLNKHLDSMGESEINSE